MKNLFQRVFKLIEQTGDRMIVFDKEGNKAYVVMDINAYEKLLNFQKNIEAGEAESDGEIRHWDIPEERDSVDFDDINKKSESEVIRGIDTELVNIGENVEQQDLPNEGNKYYFEEIEEDSISKE